MSKPIFREKPLEKLASPEQLDEMMRLTSSRPWFALIAMILILLVLLSWSFLGTVTTKVSGRGVLIKPESVSKVAALGTGKVMDIKTKSGQRVSVGDTLAIISQPELAVQLSNAKQELDFYEKQLLNSQNLEKRDINAQKDFLEKKRKDINNVAKVLKERIITLQNRIEAEEKLLDKGLIAKQDLENTKQSYTNTQHEIEVNQIQLKQLDIDLQNIIEQKSHYNDGILAQRNQALHKLRLLEAQLNVQSIITSPFSGVILEIVAKEGDLIPAGATILSIEQTTDTKDLIALVYVPAVDGKKIKVGMESHVAPSIVRVEEHGYVKGTVISVSGFPATKQAMENKIGNSQLVQSLLNEQDALIAVQIKLKKDMRTKSQYEWTASHGPDVQIQTGTLCNAQITTEKRKPIQLLFH